MQEPILKAAQIQKLLPFRYPFLMIDRVVELEPGKRGVGIKNVTQNEPYFQGHFPGEPILPGVLIVEACGQITAVVLMTEGLFDAQGRPLDATADLAAQPRKGYLASIDRFKFMQTVIPGDQLVLESVIGKRVQGLLQASVKARVGNRVVAEGQLVVTEAQ